MVTRISDGGGRPRSGAGVGGVPLGEMYWRTSIKRGLAAFSSASCTALHDSSERKNPQANDTG